MNISRDSELLFLTKNLDLDSDLDDSDIDLQELADEQLHHEIEQTETSSSNTLNSDAMSTSESTDSHSLMLSTSEKTSESIFSVSENEKKISTRSIIGDLSEANIVSGSHQ